MKYFLFFLFSFVCTVSPEGFVSNTQVKTKNGYRSIEYVHQDTVVYSYDFAKKKQQKSKVREIYRSRIPYYIRLFFEDRVVGIAPDQKLYVEALNKWICAENIVTSSFLEELCQWQMGLVHAAYVFEPIDVYIFTLKNYHTFYVTEKNILAHNFDLSFASAIPIMQMAAPAGEGFLNAMQTGDPWIIAVAGLVIGGYCLYNSIFSKQKEKKEAKLVRRKLEEERKRMLEEEQRNGVSSGGSGKDPKNNNKKNDVDEHKTKIQQGREEAKKIAKEKGWEEAKSFNFNAHGEKVYHYDKKRDILVCYDNTKHKGGFWKMFKGTKRLGTFDKTLQIRIGD